MMTAEQLAALADMLRSEIDTLTAEQRQHGGAVLAVCEELLAAVTVAIRATQAAGTSSIADIHAYVAMAEIDRLSERLAQLSAGQDRPAGRA